MIIFYLFIILYSKTVFSKNVQMEIVISYLVIQ